MLNNFFRINMPYGIAKNDKGGWMAFNREYRPIGFNILKESENIRSGYSDLEIHTIYEKISDTKLIQLAGKETSLCRDEKGEIVVVFLYDDLTNPINHKTYKAKLWEVYFFKLRLLSTIRVKGDLL